MAVIYLCNVTLPLEALVPIKERKLLNPSLEYDPRFVFGFLAVLQSKRRILQSCNIRAKWHNVLQLFLWFRSGRICAKSCACIFAASRYLICVVDLYMLPLPCRQGSANVNPRDRNDKMSDRSKSRGNPPRHSHNRQRSQVIKMCFDNGCMQCNVLQQWLSGCVHGEIINPRQQSWK